MAALEKIRKRAGLLVAVLGIALFAFIVGDLYNVGSAFGREAQEKMIVVDGNSISHKDFQAHVDLLTKIQEQYNQRSFNSEEESYQIRQMVFDMVVSDELLNELSEKTGVSISGEEISDLVSGKEISSFVRSYPAFVNPQTQQFEPARLARFVAYADSSELIQNEWRFVKMMVKNQRLQEKFGTLLVKALTPNSLDAKFAFDASQTNVDFAYVVQPYTSIVDSAITVSNDDLKKLYGDWKNRYKQQEETRGVKYFTIDIAPSEEDYLAEEQTIAEVRDSLKAATDIEQIRDVVSIIPGNKFLNAYISTKNLSAREKAFVDSASVGSVYGPYLENDVFRLIKYIGRVVTPDSVSFRQLAFPQSNEPRLLAFMDSIENLIKGGKDINELAVSMGTSAPLLSLTEIDLVRDLGESFSKEIFAAPLNQLSKIKSTNGVHLVYVTEKTQPVTKVKIAAVENPVFASSPTQNHLYNQASRFVIANADIKKFDSAARDSGYVVSPVVYLLPNNSTIGNVRRSREVVRWAFTNEPGSIKFFECEDKIVIAAIENKNKKGFRPIVAVENELRREIINSKKAEKIISELKSKPAKTLEEYAQTFQLQVDSARFVNFNTGYIADIGSSEPALEALAPIASENTLSEPVKGNKGVYLFSVYNKTQQNRTFDAKTEINNLKRASEYRIPSLFMQALRNSVNIEDNRRIFY